MSGLPSLLWKFNVSGPIRGAPAVASDGSVFVASEAGLICRLTPDGRQVWSERLEKGVYAGPEVTSDAVYLGCEDGTVRCWGLDGVVRWRFEAGTPVRGTPRVAPDGTVFFGSLGGLLFAVSSDGRERWRFQTKGGIVSRPALDPDGTVYFGSRDAHVYAVDRDGKLLWSVKTGFHVLSSPVLGPGDRLHVGSADDHFYAMDRRSGKIAWAYKATGRMNADPWVGPDGTIYMGCSDTNLYAFAPDGKLLWKAFVGGNVWPNPVRGSDGTLYVGSAILPSTREGHSSADPLAVGQGALHAISPAGKELWQFSLGGRSYPRPVVGSDGRIFASSWDGHLYCVRPPAV